MHLLFANTKYEPGHDGTPTKSVYAQQGLRPAWTSVHSDQVFVQRVTKDSSFPRVDSEDSDQIELILSLLTQLNCTKT